MPPKKILIPVNDRRKKQIGVKRNQVTSRDYKTSAPTHSRKIITVSIKDFEALKEKPKFYEIDHDNGTVTFTERRKRKFYP